MTGSIIAKKDRLSGTYLAHRLLTITFFVRTFGLLNLNAISVSSWTLFNVICRTESFSLLCTICVTGAPVSPATPALFFGWERKKYIKFYGLPKWTIREEAFIRCYLQGIGTTASRGFSWEFFLGVCRSVLRILTLFQTKKWYFPHPFSDLAFKIHTHFQTWFPRNFVVIT